MARRLLLAAIMALLPGAAMAAEAEKPPAENWTFAGPFGKFDQAAVQRGFQVYKEVCSACHSMSFLTYRNLGEDGGPLVANGKYNKAESRWEDVKLGLPEHGGRVIPANDNPYVKGLAAEYEVTELDRTSGQDATRKALPSDHFHAPYPNPFAAAAALGATPPDLSVIVKARAGGADYIAALQTGYDQPPPGETPPAPNLNYNKYFPGHWIAMPLQLTEGRVTYADGTPSTPKQMAKDVTTFLAWAAEPKQVERKQTGFAVMVFLLVLSGFLYAAYRQVWRNVKH